jgi:hypothetical protein
MVSNHPAGTDCITTAEGVAPYGNAGYSSRSIAAHRLIQWPRFGRDGVEAKPGKIVGRRDHENRSQFK